MCLTARFGVFQLAIAALSSAIIMGQSSFGSEGQGQSSFGSEAQEQVEREWGRPVGGQAISIAVEKGEYAIGDKIILDIAIRNAGNLDVRTLLTNPPAHIRVLLPDGHEAPLTQEFRGHEPILGKNKGVGSHGFGFYLLTT